MNQSPVLTISTTTDMRVRGKAGLDPMTIGGSQGVASKTPRGPPWPGAMRSSSSKRQRCTPLGLMVVEPDYVEGFLPATSRRKRCEREYASAASLRRIVGFRRRVYDEKWRGVDFQEGFERGTTVGGDWSAEAQPSIWIRNASV